MFKEVPSQINFPEIEHRILKFWEESKAFDKLCKKNKGKKKFSFLDGPITANNPMMVHHAWGRTYKDIYQRYKAMLGHELRYQNGFDCQGLWVEVEVEKELGFNSKRDIEHYGIANFVDKCKERVRKFSTIQTQQSIRLGYWMDWDNSYYTMSDENNYTIWHFLKKCHQRDWIYKGHDVMPWCPRCGTAISEHEIATEGYRQLAHPSVYLKFPIVGKENEYLLVWTTTPWTLTSNVAAAVHPELTYVAARQGGDIYYLSEGTLSALEGKYEIVKRVKGTELVGLSYDGPFDDLDAQKGVEHKVIPWNDVSEAEGTGIVHIAPGCGKEDLELSKEFKLAVIAPLDEFGIFIDGFHWLTGRSVFEVAEPIYADLQKKHRLYKAEEYTHRYPVCWRCETELVFRLVDEWFISMDELRYQIMDVAKRITWIPEFGLNHELDWLRNMHDWCISKKRYWGLALPIYECDCGHFDVIGSEVELKERAIAGWQEFAGHSPHRPWIDEVKIKCDHCGKAVSRIPDVGNPWLDAGIVPYSTMDYRNNRAYWEQWFPADFITECFPGQFRNWFYSLLAMSTVLENREPFKTVLGHALVRDERGEEMHKSKGNAISFDEAAEKMGVEVMRWMFARQNPFINLNFGFGLGEEVKRKLLTLWNSYSFFVTYANLDRIDPTKETLPVEKRSLLDRWILAKLNVLVQTARRELDRYNVATLTKEVENFLEDLSNWYVRRSRRRFWKSTNDEDKIAAYLTLHTSLVTLCQIIAPVLPFLTEEIYQNLVRSVDKTAPESVHHCDYPLANESLIDTELIAQMDATIKVVSLGRAARNAARLKVRQPLAEVLVRPKEAIERGGLVQSKSLILDELNVKEMKLIEDASAFVRYQIKPNFDLLGPKYGKLVPKLQSALKSIDSSKVAERIKKGLDFSLKVNGETITLQPDELVVETVPREGYAVAEGDGYFVALSTELTEELIAEGFAREFVHKIQNMRKQADFQVADRIRIYYQTTPTLEKAIRSQAEYIQNETLALMLSNEFREGEYHQQCSINGEEAKIGIERIKSI